MCFLWWKTQSTLLGKKKLVISNLSNIGQLHGMISITFKTLDTLVLKDTLVLSDKRR